MRLHSPDPETTERFAAALASAFDKSGLPRCGSGKQNLERWSKLGCVKVRELITLLEADGWYPVRMKGSHRQFRHPTKKGTVTVAGKLGIDVPRGTLDSALKQAGLKK